jgi:SIR2-like domain
MDDAISRIRRSLRAGYCVPVVGAGVSIPAGAHSWRSHLSALARGLDAPFRKLADDDTSDPTEVATLLLYERRRAGLAPLEIRSPPPGTLHRALAGWRCRLYLTTNFDDCMEREIQDQGGSPIVLQNDELQELDLDSCFRPLPSDAWKPVVVRLCSSVRRRNPGAETHEDFARLVAGESSALNCLTVVLRTCTTVFVGCGMGDPLLNAAIDRCFASKLGYPKSIAFVPEDMRLERKQSLAFRGVQLHSFSTDSRTKRLYELLDSCGPRADGPHHLLVFEPGIASKLSQLLEAINECGPKEGISMLGLVTSHPSFGQEVRRWGEAQVPRVQTEVFVVRDTQRTAEVLDVVRDKPVRWTALLTPYEFATGDAASFAEEYNVGLSSRLRFHSVETAKLSRNKPAFKEFLCQKFSEHNLLKSTLYEQCPIPPDATWDELLKLVRESKPGQERRHVVIKPVDAASSTGESPQFRLG